ncbi:FHA domain-containing protein [Salipiger aestuarii]|uniref:FHA domain-containing protein n=1 Tax=Salipiger aestuarii TaxID=568098 RepID=UPI001680DDFB|nr:FHA domain-containing protein [Salipiger aestuarii]
MLGFKGRIAKRRTSAEAGGRAEAVGANARSAETGRACDGESDAGARQVVSAMRFQTEAPGADAGGTAAVPVTPPPGQPGAPGDAPQATLCTQDDRNLQTIRAGLSHVPGPDQTRHAPVPPTMESARPHTPAPSCALRIWDMDPVPPATAATAHSGAVLARCAEAPTGGRDHPHTSASHRQDQTHHDQTHPAFRADPRTSAQRIASHPVRARTRLLGFHGDAAPDVVADQPAAPSAAAPRFPIGWLVVVDGPGRGASFTLTTGLSSVGRDAGQTVSLDFGDDAISREGHMSIAHDHQDGRTWVGHGGKANIVRLNDRPLLTTEELHGGDILRIGKTLLRYVALCDQGFSWGQEISSPQGNPGAGDA